MTNDYGFSTEIGSSRSYPSTLTFIHPFQYNVQYKTTLFPWLVHPLAALIDLKRTLAGKKLEISEAM